MARKSEHGQTFRRLEKIRQHSRAPNFVSVSARTCLPREIGWRTWEDSPKACISVRICVHCEALLRREELGRDYTFEPRADCRASVSARSQDESQAKRLVDPSEILRQQHHSTYARVVAGRAGASRSPASPQCPDGSRRERPAIHVPALAVTPSFNPSQGWWKKPDRQGGLVTRRLLLRHVLKSRCPVPAVPLTHSPDGGSQRCWITRRVPTPQFLGVEGPMAVESAYRYARWCLHHEESRPLSMYCNCETTAVVEPSEFGEQPAASPLTHP